MHDLHDILFNDSLSQDIFFNDSLSQDIFVVTAGAN
jgi:hypothetical protein